MNSAIFKIDGMHCDGCAERIKTVVEKEPGVRAAAVSFPAGDARVTYNPHAVTEEWLAGIIERAGFTVRKE